MSPNIKRPPRLLAIDTRAGAHASYFVQYLAQRFLERGEHGELKVLLPPGTPLSSIELTPGSESVIIAAIDQSHWQAIQRSRRPYQRLLRWMPPLRNRLALRLKYISWWEVSRRVLAQERPEACLLLNLDDLLLPLLVDPPETPRLTGLFFKPTFHYSKCFDSDLTRPQRARAFLQGFLVRRFLASSKRGLLSMDPFAAEHLLQRSPHSRIHHVPEPAPGNPASESEVAQLRHALGLDPSRHSFLLFGALSARRGLHEVLAAFSSLPDETLAKASLLLVGPIAEPDEARSRAALLALSSRPLQLIRVVDRIPHSRALAYFQLADVVLVTHRNHVGSSGNLVLAAAAARPVIATRFGLIGALVDQNQLGLRLDPSSIRAMASAITRLVQKDELPTFSPSSALAFAASNTPRSFADAVLARALPGSFR